MDTELSCHMMTEILSRASLETLDIMRCTSKELNTLTYESYLSDLYKKRNKIVSGFLIQRRNGGWMQEFAPSPESTSLDLRFLPYNTRVLATCEQGIMVFRSWDDELWKDLYYVCKPATKQVLALPNPEEKHTDEKFAIVVMGLKPLRYKIIRFSHGPVLRRWGKFYTAYCCDIFDSMTWEWRSLKHVKLPYCVSLTTPQPVTKSGSIYTLLTNNDILKFDVYSEKWKVLSSPIPYDRSADRPWLELVKYGGGLALACKPLNGRWEIWALKTGRQSWEKICVCNEKEGSWESFMALYDLDTSVMVDRHALVFYKFKKEGDNMVSKVALNYIPRQIFSFRSDFEQIDLR